MTFADVVSHNFEHEGLEGNTVKRFNARIHPVSLNEMLAGCSLPQHTANNGSEFPSWSFGEEFEIEQSPATPVASMMVRDDSNMYTGKTTTPNQYLSFNKSTYEPSVVFPQPSATTVQKNTHVNAFPPLKNLEGQYILPN
jgi:hypothetical protein